MSVKELFKLDGKIALITGGSRGLGLQMAEALGEMGCKLAITARKADELNEAKAHLEQLGLEVLTIVNDLSKTEQIPGMVDQVVQRFGTIDILVNNAGATWSAPAEEYPDEAWRKVLGLNVDSIFFLSREVARRCVDSPKIRQDHQRRLGGRLARQCDQRQHDCLSHLQGRGGQLHACTSLGMGQVQHQRQCDLPRIFPIEDVGRPAGKSGRCSNRPSAVTPYRWR